MPRWGLPRIGWRIDAPGSITESVVSDDPPALETDPTELLPEVARAALARALGVAGPVEPEVSDTSPLRGPGACFVTLRRSGDLRGCIGSLEPARSLLDDVRLNVCAAAFDDPRFAPLAAEELPDLTIEVSVLSPKEPVEFSSEEDLVARLCPGRDGLLLVTGRHRGTFLPAVWEQIPDPVVFLRELKRKAGLDRDYWSDDIRVWRYSTTMHSE